MLVLAIECSAAACSAALAEGDDRGADILAHRFVAAERGHAGRLMPMVEQVLAAAGRGFAAPDLFAATVGPGSYTGIRIGLAAARGMALAAAKPLIGITTIEAVAARIADRHEAALVGAATLAIALETKRSDLYTQYFTPDLDALSEPAAEPPEAAAAALPDGPVLVAGDAAGRLVAAVHELRGPRADATALADDHGLPDAVEVARLALARAARLGTERGPDWAASHAAPEPLYLRPPHVTLPAGRRKE